MSPQGYHGPKSDHFNGEKFSNYNSLQTDKSLWTLLKWRFSGDKATWPEWVESSQQQVPQTRVKEGISLTFINHSTVLIQVQGVNILTDPTYADRASPFSWIGPKRVRLPGVAFDSLPPIDIVLVSHNHYDHFDVPTLTKIAQRDNPLILFGLGSSNLLEEKEQTRFLEMDWKDRQSVKQIPITFERAQHWSARWIDDRREHLWGSFILETKEGKIYFAGDTGYSDHFNYIGRTYGPFKLCLLPIGHYEPRWFMKNAHVNPEESVKAHKELGCEQSLGIHFGTFPLTDESIEQPLIDLENALKENQVSPQDFFTLDFGETKKINSQTEQ